MTPQYSIENLYVGSGTVRNFFVAACGLSTINDEDEEIVDYVVSMYNSARQFYVSSKSVRRMNLAYLYIRKVLGNKLISLDSLFTITHVLGANYGYQIVLKKKAWEVIENLDKISLKKFLRECVVAKKILEGDVDYFRGKQELSFLREFISSIRSENQILHQLVYAKTGKLLKFKNTSIGNDILSDLSFAALTPVCLSKFLDDAASHFEKSSV